MLWLKSGQEGVFEMSRIAKNPVVVPDGLDVKIETDKLIVKGKNSSLSINVPAGVLVQFDNGYLTFSVANDNNKDESDAMAGTIRAVVANMVHGISEGFEKKLQLVGVGYRAQAQGSVLNLSLGFSHPIIYNMPAGVSVQTPSPTEIILSGADKQVVGQVAAEIRRFRPPEPYKGKGVRYANEMVVLKEAKKK